MRKEKTLSIFLQMLASLPLIIVFAGVIWQVFSRYILSIPSKNSEELIRFSLVFLTFLSGAYCFVINRHISLDLIETKKTRIVSLIVKMIRAIFILIFSVFILIYGGLFMAVSQYEQVSSSFNVSMFYIYMIMPISGIIIFVSSILTIYQTIVRK